MSIHDALIEEANYQAFWKARGGPVAPCVDLLNRSAAHIAAQDATIALLRAEVRAWRKWLDEMRKSIGDVAIAQKTPSLDMARDAVSAAMIATDAANALEGP